MVDDPQYDAGTRSNPKPDDPNGPQTPSPEGNSGRPNLPPELKKHLSEKGYKLLKMEDGTYHIIKRGFGFHEDSKNELKMFQHLYNKFGILNQSFDPTRAAYFQGSLYDLTAGVKLGENNGGYEHVASGALDNLRERSGWSWEAAYQKELDNVPAWEREAQIYKSLEDWQKSKMAYRENLEHGSDDWREGDQTPPEPAAPVSTTGIGTMVYQPAFNEDDIQADYI